jgi:hypothetical protein
VRVSRYVVYGIPVVALFLFRWFAPYYSTQIMWEGRKALFWLLPLAAVAACACVALAGFAMGEGAGGSAKTSLRTVGGLFAAATVAALVGGVWWAGSTHGYLQARDYYTATTVTSDPVPVIGQRAPYTVAHKQAQANLGDQSGDIDESNYLPATDTYTTLLNRRGPLQGYQTLLSQTLPLTGHGVGRTCGFDRAHANRSLAAFFGHSLGRAVNTARRDVNWSASDVYAYCDSAGAPVVVVPLKKQTGWTVVTERPAGVALYNGKTGALTFRDDGAGLPGPSYPLSIAARQREALNAPGGYWDYRANRTGHEADSEPDSPNVQGGNSTEFVAAVGARGHGGYLTMVTGRGSATSISAVAVVDANPAVGQLRHGLAPLTLHMQRPAWKSPGAVAKRIRADYGDIPNWQQLHIFEVIPIGGNRWAATIGNDQNVLYRVQGDGTLPDDPTATCLHEKDGTAIRCGTRANIGGNGVGVQYGPDGTPQAALGPATVVVRGDDLTTLSPTELATLQRQITDEYIRRLTKPAPSPSR